MLGSIHRIIDVNLPVYQSRVTCFGYLMPAEICVRDIVLEITIKLPLYNKLNIFTSTSCNFIKGKLLQTNSITETLKMGKKM